MLWRRGKAYSQDLRDRVLARADSGDRVGQIAKALQVSVSYVSKALSQRRETGETARNAITCHRSSLTCAKRSATKSPRSRMRRWPSCALAGGRT